MWRTIRQPCAHDNAMLRFRPIAPKPATCPGESSLDIVSAFSGEKRRKRKYVRVRRNSRYTRRTEKKPAIIIRDSIDSNGVSKSEDSNSNSKLLLLQLLPERSSDLDAPIESGLDVSRPSDESSVVVMIVVAVTLVQAKTTEEKCHHRTARSWILSLDSDTCPGFVSDGSDGVTWINGAFRKMVTESDNGGDGDRNVVVGLVIKERFPSFYSAITGHVKLQYYYNDNDNNNSHARESKPHSRVVPCDLWRIDGGGFAWKLDVDSALTLGRS